MSKRIKQCCPPEQVAHLWANQSQPHAHTPRQNFYFDGDTIYSYGRHFPLARHISAGPEHNRRRAVILTTKGYSSTTAKHKRIVDDALCGLDLPVFAVQDIDGLPESHLANRKYFHEQFADYLRKAATATKYTERFIAAARRVAVNAQKYAHFFRLKWAPLTITPATQAKADKAIKTQRAAAKVKSAADRERNALREHTQQWAAQQIREVMLPQWLAGADPAPQVVPAEHKIFGNYLYWTPQFLTHSDDYAYLRVKPTDPQTVETTRGAEFPLEHARRAYSLLSTLRARGEGYTANGHTIHVGGFTVDSMDTTTGLVSAGCHRVEWSEVERFARLQGWLS